MGKKRMSTFANLTIRSWLSHYVPSPFTNLRFAHGLSLRLSPFAKTNPTYKSNGKSHHKHTKKSIENIQSCVSESGVSFTPGGRKQRSNPSRASRPRRFSSSVRSRCPVYTIYSQVVGYISYIISFQIKEKSV